MKSQLLSSIIYISLPQYKWSFDSEIAAVTKKELVPLTISVVESFTMEMMMYGHLYVGWLAYGSCPLTMIELLVLPLKIFVTRQAYIV